MVPYRTFETDIPHHLTLFSEQIQGYLRAFHKDVIASAKRTISDEKEQQLKSTLMAYGEAVSQHMRSASDVVKYDQRSVSRMIASVILEELAATYLTSARHRGKNQSSFHMPGTKRVQVIRPSAEYRRQ